MNKDRLSMRDLAGFMIDFDVNTIAEADSVLEGYEAMYILTGTHENLPLRGSAYAYGYALAVAKTCVKKLKRLPAHSRSGRDSLETLKAIHIPDVLLCRASGIHIGGRTPAVNTAKIDKIAERLGITRSELVNRVLEQHIEAGHPLALSQKCIMYAHDVLQRVVHELKHLGFEDAEYEFYVQSYFDTGSFGVGAEGRRIKKLCDAGLLPRVQHGIPWKWCTGDDEYAIMYDHPSDSDEKQIFTALKAMSAWAVALHKIDPDTLKLSA